MSEKEREAATLHVTQQREATRHLTQANLPNPNPSLPRPPPPAGADVMTYWKTLPATTFNVSVGGVPQGVVLPPPEHKSVLEAYILCLVLGFLGAHHFYLNRPGFGIMYLLSFGLLGCGWVIDLLRMPCLVESVNKKNREKHEQLTALQQQLTQQRQQQQQGQQPQYPVNVVFMAFEPKSLADAYIMWFPCGLFGFHHFYLRNYGMGFVYLFTLGLLGIGWLVDLFRMPYLVKEANSCSPNSSNKQYSQCTAHVLALSPAGIMGGHHYYLDRPVWGLLYTFTFGLLGVGWVFDWFRTSVLVKRANSVSQGMTSPNRKYVDDAYVLCIPFGFTGLHHFYLRRYVWGCLYFFTFGILGVGWLVDWFRLPCLVKECNNSSEALCRRLIHTPSPSLSSVAVAGVTGTGNSVTNYGLSAEGPVTVAVSPGQPPFGAPGNPVYPPAAGYGYQCVYPAMAGYAGPYPTYMEPGGGAAMVPPPPYSADTAPATTLPQSDQGQPCPRYEAAPDSQTNL